MTKWRYVSRVVNGWAECPDPPLDTADAWLVKQGAHRGRWCGSRYTIKGPAYLKQWEAAKAWWECLPAFADGVAAYRRYDFCEQQKRQAREVYMKEAEIRHNWEKALRWYEGEWGRVDVTGCTDAEVKKRRDGEYRYFVWGQRAGVILWTGIAVCLTLLAFA